VSSPFLSDRSNVRLSPRTLSTIFLPAFIIHNPPNGPLSFSLLPHPQHQVPECLEKFQELKQGKKLSYVIYGLSDDKKSIVVLKTSNDKDFDKFVAELPEKECRWAVYDFEYTLEGGEGIRNKLTFVQWCVFTSYFERQNVLQLAVF